MDESNTWDIGGTLREIAGDYFSYRTATAPRVWSPYPAGSPLAIAPDGRVYQSGLSGGIAAPAGASSLLLLALLIGGAILAFRALK